MRRPLLPFGLALHLAGCGGIVVFEEDGGEGGATQVATAVTMAVSVGSGSVGPSGTSVSGSATASGGGATASSSGNATSSGHAPCETHDDCTGGVCLQGLCAPRCEGCDACAPGTVCEPCATSSCPGCDDCVAACVPTSEGRCDDDDPCPGADQVCLFPYGYCTPTCESGECADPNMACSECATGSCCGCKNCVSACFPVDG